MKLFKILIVLLCLLGSYTLRAQALSDDINNSDSFKKDYWSVRWAPLSIFEPHTPSIRFSGEFNPARFNNKYGFKLDLGYGIEEWKKHVDTSGPTEFSMEYRVEGKYFPKAESDKWRYISAELFFIDHNLKDGAGTYLSETDVAYSYTSSDIAINTAGFNLKVGENYYFASKDMVIDLYFGLGVRMIDVRHDPVEAVVTTDHLIGVSSMLPELSDREGLKIGPNITAGIQIGFNL